MSLDIYDPFMTVFRDLDRRGDERNPEEEARELLTRETLIEELITGQGHLDTALDCLAEQGIDPDAWLEQTVANMEWVIDNGIRFTSNDHGIFLPENHHA